MDLLDHISFSILIIRYSSSQRTKCMHCDQEDHINSGSLAFYINFYQDGMIIQQMKNPKKVKSTKSELGDISFIACMNNNLKNYPPKINTTFIQMTGLNLTSPSVLPGFVQSTWGGLEVHGPTDTPQPSEWLTSPAHRPKPASMRRKTICFTDGRIFHYNMFWFCKLLA